MEPDESRLRDKKCCMCNELTDRVIDGQPVCDKHFIEGWGRLPEMPLPQPSDSPPVHYYCGKCERHHTFTSKIGKRHLKYRR